MTRQVTLAEYVLRDTVAFLNQRARKRGEDVEIVLERSKPRLVAEGEVVQLKHEK
jgi:hypothetical protein